MASTLPRSYPLRLLFVGVPPYLKHKVYGEKITSIQHLKEVITRHIEELKTNTGLLREVMYGVSTRINQCIAVDGAHFEQRR